MRPRGLILALCLCAVAANCKRARTYAQATPEQAIGSFFAAVSAGRIPADVDALVADEAQATMWKMRCEPAGCASGSYSIDEVDERNAYKATVLVTYEVKDKHGARIIAGQRSPITLVIQSGNWFITQFGAKRAPPPRDNHEGG